MPAASGEELDRLGATAERDRAAACSVGPAFQRLTFLHVNDLHASYNLGKDGVSPYARIRGYYETVRSENPYTLLTDGGDDHEKGSVAELLSGGIATAEATRALRFDVRVLGNHDFAWGADRVLAFSHDPHGIVLASNTKYIGGPSRDFGARDFASMVAGCVRVGFFGMVSKPWDERDRQYTGDFLPEFHSRWDFRRRAAEIVSAHRAEVDVMVMVSHLGLDEDRAVAESVPGIDLVLGGHSHETTAEPAIAGQTLIVQAGSHSAELARLDIDYDRREGRIRDHHLTVKSVEALPWDPSTNEAIVDTLRRYAPRATVPLAWVEEQRGRREIARIAARAAVEADGLDAAIVDERTVSSTWSEHLVLDQQALLDTFRVERQRANTPGFSSMYVAQIDGSVLARVVRELPSQLAYEGPLEPATGRSYRLGLQKAAAMHSSELLPGGVKVGQPVFLREMWEALETFAHSRSRACRYLDSDSEPSDRGPCRSRGSDGLLSREEDPDRAGRQPNELMGRGEGAGARAEHRMLLVE